MKSKVFSITIVLVLFLALGVGAARADYGYTDSQPLAPMGQSFTYQGKLNDSAGNPIDGSCDFQFILYDALTGGAQIGPTLDKTNTSVADGYFTVGLDFGSSAFLGEARWMEVAVRCPAGGGAYTTLNPLQALTAAPYALDADLLDGQHATAFSSTEHNHWGQSWTGSDTGLTLSGGTTGLSSSGSTYGVTGISAGKNGFGVYGYASDTSSYNYGVVGSSASTFGMGVYGNADATTGTTYGVTGVSSSTSGNGVYGGAIANTGYTYGVYGVSNSIDGTGVYGYANATSGGAKGVYGISDSTNGIGVLGNSSATTGSTYGVYGQSDSTSGTGVYGYATDISGSASGVVGISDSITGFGVKGWADNGNGNMAAGVYGLSYSDNGFGVAGYNYFNGVGIGAWSYGGDLIRAYSGEYPGGTLEFYITGAGNVYTNGAYYTFKTSSLDGETHATSSIQSTEAWLEDFGRGDLVDGVAVITITPDLAGMANLSVDYMVFVSLEGDCQGVYITNKTPTTFEVHELNGGISDVPFGYRIVAKPTGSETIRLPEVNIPDPIEGDRQPDGTTLPPTPPQPPQAPAPMEQVQLPVQVQP